MDVLTGLLAGLDESAAVLFILAGLIYGLFGWRLVRFLVIVDALAVAGMCALWFSRRGGVPWIGGDESTISVALMMALLLPLLAWRFPRVATVAMAGLAGFVSVQLFLLDSDLPFVVLAILGFIGGAFAMGLAVSLSRQTTVVVTGLHGGWLCVGAMSILAANHTNFIGQMLNSFAGSFVLVTPAAALAFSSIMIFLQWSDMQGHTAQS